MIIDFIMYSFLFGWMSVLSIVSALDSDPTWFLDGDLSSDTDLSLNPGVLTSALPLNLDFGSDLITPSADSYSTDISSNDELPWDTELDDSSNLFNFDSPLLVADCSSSESFPTIGKSRLRRADRPKTCNNGAVNSGASDEISLPTELFSPGGFNTLEQQITDLNEAENSQCVLLSLGALPAGVCSSGRIEDLSVTGGIFVNEVQLITSTLRHVTLCTSLLEFLPFLACIKILASSFARFKF